MRLEHLLCVDWGKAPKKRAACLASVQARRVVPLPAWDRTLGGLLDEAERLAGPTLIAVDAPLGVPASFAAACRRQGIAGDDFPRLIDRLAARDGFFTRSDGASSWTPLRPFFAVPKGPGALTAFEQVARSAHGVELRRTIEVRTAGKSTFVLSGIPGTVGSGAVALWRELLEARATARDVALWPFDGSLEALVAGRRPILAELYPRAAYALALAPSLQPAPPRLAVGKGRAAVRQAFLDELAAAAWVRRLGVSLDGIAVASADEDAFDALVSAAALLRCVLEDRSLASASWPQADVRFEGGIVATASIALEAPEASYRPAPAGDVARPARHR